MSLKIANKFSLVFFFFFLGHVINVRETIGEDLNSSKTQNNTIAKGRSLDASSTATGHLVAEGNKTRPLDDLSLDDVPMLMMTPGSFTFPTTPKSSNSSMIKCSEDSKTYSVGERFNKGCNESCECGKNGKVICEERCKLPLQRKGLTKKDEFCQELPTEDECCAIVQCTQDTGNSSWSPHS